MYALLNSFSNKIISRHRTVDNAVKADDRLQSAVKRSNGPGSYIPTRLVETVDGELVPVDEDEVAAAIDRLWNT